ncbi:MAG TPA: hypothetical protein DCE55_21305 [Planctomycetaceae bacterium]|nr:hypothetical protein [Planctomycetaceae bacterium]
MTKILLHTCAFARRWSVDITLFCELRGTCSIFISTALECLQDVNAHYGDQPEGNLIYAFSDTFFSKSRGIITVLQIDQTLLL